MGGTIWVESEVRLGSTFHFTALLPWAELQDGISPASTSYAISHGSDSARCVAVLWVWVWVWVWGQQLIVE